jgi:ribosomal protein S18 acetylase RimI-like enzyme
MDIAALPPALFAEAVSLWQATGLTRPWNDPHADLQRGMRGPSSTVLACSEGGKLLGTAMVGHDGHRGWVYYLAVVEEHRRRGIGRMLMSACEAWVVEQDVPKLQLMVRNGNHGVLAFYERLNYEVNDVVVLARRLDS